MHLHKILVLAFINTLITVPAGTDGVADGQAGGQAGGAGVTRLDTLSVSL